MILLLIVLILILTLSFKEHFNEIYLQDPFIYQQLNKIKDNGLDPLTYQQSLDNFGEYKKYRKSYKFPKYGKYMDSVDVIDNKPYTSLGCWNDNPNNRAITPSIPGYNYWDNISVDECAKKTKQAGFSVFGSQYGLGTKKGQCFSSHNALNTYNKYGKSDYCRNGTGGANANNVYQIKNTTQITHL